MYRTTILLVRLTILLSALVAFSVASPLGPGLSRRDNNVPWVTMTFTGGPASYTSTFLANGLYNSLSFPDDQLSVSQISATGITDIAQNCTFWDGATIITNAEFVANADGSLTMGPPGPITGVSCGNPGQCAPLYGMSNALHINALLYVEMED